MLFINLKMKLISNFAELYYSDQLPTELHDWFIIEECDRAWNWYRDIEQTQIPSFLDGLQARYGISIGKISNCPRGNAGERYACARDIDCLYYWKDTKKFHTLHKKRIREDIHYLNKLHFHWWYQPSTNDIGYAIRQVNSNYPKSKNKENIQKEIDRLVESFSSMKTSIPFQQ